MPVSCSGGSRSLPQHARQPGRGQVRHKCGTLAALAGRPQRSIEPKRVNGRSFGPPHKPCRQGGKGLRSAPRGEASERAMRHVLRPCSRAPCCSPPFRSPSRPTPRGSVRRRAACARARAPSARAPRRRARALRARDASSRAPVRAAAAVTARCGAARREHAALGRSCPPREQMHEIAQGRLGDTRAHAVRAIGPARPARDRPRRDVARRRRSTEIESLDRAARATTAHHRAGATVAKAGLPGSTHGVTRPRSRTRRSCRSARRPRAVELPRRTGRASHIVAGLRPQQGLNAARVARSRRRHSRRPRRAPTPPRWRTRARAGDPDRLDAWTSRPRRSRRPALRERPAPRRARARTLSPADRDRPSCCRGPASSPSTRR